MTASELARDIAGTLRAHPELWGQYASIQRPAKCLVHHMMDRLHEAGIELQECAPYTGAFWTALGRSAKAPIEAWNGLICWNDTPGREVDEVIALCERVRDGR